MNVSVIIPTYNRYIFLKRALVSLYAQTYPPKEIIVVDDGSTDDTSYITVILNSIQNLNPNIIIKYIYQNNSGVSSARNMGIRNASFEWIAFLDSDDEWHKTKLEKQVDFHKNNINILMSYTDELWIRDGVEVKIPKKFKKIGKDIFSENIEYCNIAPSSVLVSREILNYHALVVRVQNDGTVQNDGEFFDESLEVCEDYDLWLRIALKHEIGLVDEPLITKYAGHDDQLSFKHWGMDRFRVVALEKLLKSEAKATPLKKTELLGGTTSVVHEQQSEPKATSLRNTTSSSFSGLTRESTQALILKELRKKYTILLKGAIKHDKISDKKNYLKRLRELNEPN